MRALFLTAGAVLLVGACAAQPTLDPSLRLDASNADEVVVADAATGSTRLVCRRTHVTGSRLGDRVCRTEAEWEQFEIAQARRTEVMRDSMERALGLPPIPPGGAGGGGEAPE